MDLTAIVAGDVYTPRQTIAGGVVLIKGRRILNVGPAEQVEVPEGARRVQAEGLRVVPGLIDLHSHGLLGHDVMGPALAEAIPAYPRAGVTSFMATTYTAPPDAAHAAITEMAAVLDEPPPGARCLGVHIEGPHLSPEQPGAADPQWLRPLTWEDFETLQAAAGGHIAMITFAPEEGQALELIPRLRQVGVVPVLGHSRASFDQVQRAVELGLDHAAHTFNAMGGFHHRRPGTVGGVLHFEQIYAQVIADGVHVHPAALRLLLRAKGLARTVLISDSSPFALQPPGDYEWHGRAVQVRDGRCQLKDGTLAGAHALPDHGLRTLVDTLDLPLADALTTATATPAAALELNSKGRLAPGWDADLALLNDQLEVVRTYVEGRQVWPLE